MQLRPWLEKSIGHQQTEVAMIGVDGSCHTPEPMMQTGLPLGREG